MFNALRRPIGPSIDIDDSATFEGKSILAETVSFGIVGNDPKMRDVVSLAMKVANSRATVVLLEGESGTGKDLVARAIHSASARESKPFMEINCGAIPENLIESELMGHEAGAFTSARGRKTGLFELADGGTVFLDEVSELRLAHQVKLLRLVETKRFKRVGGTEEIRTDARIIASTNRSLEELVRRGAFREDLYYRLKVIPISLPPLRERRCDIPVLVAHFVETFNEELDREVKGATDEAVELLSCYSWPGNVRELKNVIERCMVLGEGEMIQARHLPIEFRTGGGETPLSSASGRPACGVRLTREGVDLRDLERSLIRQSLEMTGGNQVRAAMLVGLGRDAFRYRMKKHGLLGFIPRRAEADMDCKEDCGDGGHHDGASVA